MHAGAHTHTHTHTHTHAHTHMHTHMHTHTHTHTHTHKHTYTIHTHTHTQQHTHPGLRWNCTQHPLPSEKAWVSGTPSTESTITICCKQSPLSSLQHVKLSEQIRPWDTLACCWDVKQPTNKQTNSSLQTRQSKVIIHLHFISNRYQCTSKWPPRWPSGKVSTSRAEDPGFESRLCRDFSGVESYQWLQNWHSSGYPARRLAL